MSEPIKTVPVRNKSGAHICFDYGARTYEIPDGESDLPEEVALAAQSRLSARDFQLVHPEAEAKLAAEVAAAIVPPTPAAEEKKETVATEPCPLCGKPSIPGKAPTSRGPESDVLLCPDHGVVERKAVSPAETAPAQPV